MTSTQAPKLRRLLATLGLSFIALLVSGCNQYDPTRLSEQQMADELVQTWKADGAESAEIKKVASGYEGTVKLAGGETLKVTITSDPATKSARIVAIGDRGTNLEYTLKAEKKSRF